MGSGEGAILLSFPSTVFEDSSSDTTVLDFDLFVTTGSDLSFFLPAAELVGAALLSNEETLSDLEAFLVLLLVGAASGIFSVLDVSLLLELSAFEASFSESEPLADFPMLSVSLVCLNLRLPAGTGVFSLVGFSFLDAPSSEESSSSLLTASFNRLAFLVDFDGASSLESSLRRLELRKSLLVPSSLLWSGVGVLSLVWSAVRGLSSAVGGSSLICSALGSLRSEQEGLTSDEADERLFFPPACLDTLLASSLESDFLASASFLASDLDFLLDSATVTSLSLVGVAHSLAAVRDLFLVGRFDSLLSLVASSRFFASTPGSSFLLARDFLPASSTPDEPSSMCGRFEGEISLRSGLLIFLVRTRKLRLSWDEGGSGLDFVGFFFGAGVEVAAAVMMVGGA